MKKLYIMDVVKNSAKLPRRWQRDKSVFKSCTGATTRASAMKNKRSQRHLLCKLLLLLLLQKISKLLLWHCCYIVSWYLLSNRWAHSIKWKDTVKLKNVRHF